MASAAAVRASPTVGREIPTPSRSSAVSGSMAIRPVPVVTIVPGVDEVGSDAVTGVSGCGCSGGAPGSGVDDDVDRAAAPEELGARAAAPAVDQQVDRIVADR